MSNPAYQKFVKQWEEVMDVPEQQVGPLTPIYKIITRHLKVMPWPVLMAISILAVIGLYTVVGSTITFFVTLLQRGF